MIRILPLDEGEGHLRNMKAVIAGTRQEQVVESGATRAPIEVLRNLPLYEGEAPAALPLEGATRAPIIE